MPPCTSFRVKKGDHLEVGTADVKLRVPMQTQLRGGGAFDLADLRGGGVSGGSLSSRGWTWYCSITELTTT